LSVVELPFAKSKPGPCKRKKRPDIVARPRLSSATVLKRAIWK
jgi:hypothetical protein